MIPTIFDCCRPREDVLSARSSDYAATLRDVIAARGVAEYSDPKLFFANTFPTDGLRRLLSTVGTRLAGRDDAAGATIRLDSTFGGGKTHGLIALAHLARTPDDVPAEFLDPARRPSKPVTIAAFDGEMANVVEGVELEPGVRAKTPWGYLAYKLGGLQAFERLRANDEQCSAPGSEDWLAIIGDRPALILIDEIGEWLRKLRNAGDQKQLAPFLKGLMAAVEARPDACLVLSLAVGASGRAVDAFAQENERVATALQEAEAVSARQAVILTPTREDETASVLARRLFASVDRERAAPVIEAYARVWEAQRAHLPDGAASAERREALANSYPFHPDLIQTLNAKTATFQNFQRVRGMLRILAPTVRALWEKRPSDATAIHVHHIDIGATGIRTEFTTRLGQQAYDSAISYDIANADPLQPARAQRIDDRYFRGAPPLGSYVARTIFVNSMAFNQELRGLSVDQLRAQMLAPGFGGAATEGGATFIEEARKHFSQESGYLDDRTTTVLRFAAEWNLTKLIEQTKADVDPAKVRDELRREIHGLFRAASPANPSLEFVAFPAGPTDVPDDANDGKPFLAVIGYEAEAIDADVTAAPPLIARIAQFKGVDATQLRLLRNNVVYLLADGRKRGEMTDAVARRIALEDLDERSAGSLAEHQRGKLRELKEESKHRCAVAIQQCYRHVLFPSGAALDAAGLAHLALEVDNASANPGAGQKAVVRALRNHQKLNTPEDLAINAAAIRDKASQFRSRGSLTTRDLREEFRRDRNLPMLLGDEPFRKLAREGVARDVFVYVKGDVVYAAGMPPVAIEIGENAFLFTKVGAQEAGIWPRRVPEPKAALPDEPRTDPADGEKPPLPPPPPPPAGAIVAEGPLREAFARLRDAARERGHDVLRSLTITSGILGDAGALVRYAPSVRGASASVTAELSYETSDDSSCRLRFEGTAAEARHPFDFAAQQIAVAREHFIDLQLSLTYDSGLSLEGGAYEKLADDLGRVAPGEIGLESQP